MRDWRRSCMLDQEKQPDALFYLATRKNKKSLEKLMVVTKSRMLMEHRYQVDYISILEILYYTEWKNFQVYVPSDEPITFCRNRKEVIKTNEIFKGSIARKYYTESWLRNYSRNIQQVFDKLYFVRRLKPLSTDEVPNSEYFCILDLSKVNVSNKTYTPPVSEEINCIENFCIVNVREIWILKENTELILHNSTYGKHRCLI